MIAAPARPVVIGIGGGPARPVVIGTGRLLVPVDQPPPPKRFDPAHATYVPEVIRLVSSGAYDAKGRPLDPQEAIITAPKLRPVKVHKWRALGVVWKADRWRPGWDRTVRAPARLADVPGGDGARWREAGVACHDGWREDHALRAKVGCTCIPAGYYARESWERFMRGMRQVGPHEVEDWRYRDGPAKDCVAVDPWDVAHKLRFCGASWYVQLRYDAEAAHAYGLPTPRLCGMRHVCPVCASLYSRRLAHALRLVVAKQHEDEPANLALVTLTQRAVEGETLAQALARYHAGWVGLVGGSRSARFNAFFSDAFSGIEATRGAEGSNGAPGRWWHLHAHVIVRLRPGVSVHAAREQLGLWWQASSARAAERAGLPGKGWDPAAGGCSSDSWEGGWWREIEPGDDQALYQAAKYPTPVATLHPHALAEFLAVAHGRRFHQGRGTWRSVLRLAEALEAQGYVPPSLRAGDAHEDDEPRVRLGVNIGGGAPGEAPNLDDVAPGLGIVDEDGLCGVGSPPPDGTGIVAWRLLNTPEAAAAADYLVGQGGRIALDDRDQRWIAMPAAWAHRLVVETETMLTAARARRAKKMRNAEPRG